MEIGNTSRCSWGNDVSSTPASPDAASQPKAPAAPAAGAADTATLSWGARAAALFAALDADQDGAITEDEFKAGAKALLQRGRGAERAHHGEHGHQYGRRLEHRLERLFDKVDGNGDGAVSKDELTAALSRSSAPAEPPPAEPTPAPTASATSTVVSVTFVAVAVRSYTSVGQLGAEPAAPTATGPAGATKA